MGLGKDLLSGLSSGLTGGLSTLAGSLGSAVSGGLNYLFQGLQQKRDHEYYLKRAEDQQQRQFETMDKQQQQAVDFWNMQNEYNDPSAVADRYRNAGINPLNAFGGSVVGLGASSAPMPSAGSAYGAGAGSPSSAGLVNPVDVALSGSQMKKTESDIEYTGLLGDLTKENIISQKLAHRIERVEADFAEYSLFNRKALSDDSVKRSGKELEKLDRENEKLLAEFQSIMQGIAESYSRENLNNEQKKLIEKQISKVAEEIAILSIDKQTRGKYNEAQINKMNAEANYFLEQAKTASTYRDFLSANADLLRKYGVAEDDRHKLFEATKDFQEQVAKAKAEEARMDSDGFGKAMYRCAQVVGVVGSVFGGTYNVSTSTSDVNTTSSSTSAVTSHIFKH